MIFSQIEFSSLNLNCNFFNEKYCFLCPQDVQKQLTLAASAAAASQAGQKVQIQKIGTSISAAGQQQSVTTLTQQQAAAAAASGQQCVQVSQATMPTAQLLSPLQQQGAQQMQFTSPWIPQMGQFWTANGLQLASNPIIFRNTGPDGSSNMFIQQSPQQAIQQAHNRKFEEVVQV